MESEKKSKFQEIIDIMKNKIGNKVPVSDFKVRIIFLYFKRTKEINNKLEYLIKVMETMEFEGEKLKYDPKYAIFYDKFFDIVLSNLKGKKNGSSEITMTINIDDLSSFNELEKKIIFWYLEFSLLIENSLLIFFSFLNHQKNVNKLEATFTYLNYDYINDANELSIFYQREIKSKELKKLKQNKEINLIGFETEEEKFNIIKNSSQKKKKENNKQMTNSSKKGKLLFPENKSVNLNNNNKNGSKKEEFPKNMKLDLNNEEKKSTTGTNNLNNEEKKSTTGTNNLNAEEKKSTTGTNNLNAEEKNNIKIEICTFEEKKESSIENIKVKTQNKIEKIIEISPEKEKQDKSFNENSKNIVEEINKEKMILNPKSEKKESPDNSQKKVEDKNIILSTNLNDNRDNNEYNITDLLKKGISGIKVSSYIAAQKFRYRAIYKSSQDALDNIQKLNINSLNFNFFSNSMNFWKIESALQKITTLFSNGNNIIKPNYGFFVKEKEIIFYVPVEEGEIYENEIKFNSIYLKQLDYNYALEKESSYKTYSIKGKDDEKKVDYFVIKGLDFEKNWQYFFDFYFELPKIPNIFFPAILDKNDNKDNINFSFNKDEIIFKNYMDNLFSTFIETDVARININSSDINPNIFYKPYINEFPIHVYFKKELNDWVCEIIEKDEFKVYANSIVLAEIKNSIPDKVLNIEETAVINKKDIQRALYFVIYKLIKKIEYYYYFIKYEYLINSEKIDDYKFQLFLIYDNKPISQMNNYICVCLNNLIKKNLIKNEFIFQIIYSVPAISNFNMYNLSQKLNASNKKISQNEEELKNLKNEIKNLKNVIADLKGRIPSHNSEANN